MPYVDRFFDKFLNNYDNTEADIENEVAENPDEDLQYILNIRDTEKIDKTKKNDYILLVLLKEFYELYYNEKFKRRIVSISDFQKLTLKLLHKKDDNGYSPLAQKYQQKFKRIMVDEYQDTSDIQEEILSAISDNFNNYNVFMVGDVKQCIYAFRNAKPNIFNAKYEQYVDVNQIKDNVEKQNILIKFNKNYRSSAEVIDTTNKVFEKLMIKNYGNIDYKEEGVKLLHGRDEEKAKYKGIDKKTYLPYYFVVIALEYVFDVIANLHDIDGIDYKDIVILHPTPSSLIDEYSMEAAKRDIPFVGNLKAGFYNSYEIVLMCAILSIIDNPVNDVDLSTVLLSKVINMTDNDFVLIKCINKHIKKADNLSRRFFSLYETISRINDDEDLERVTVENKIISEKDYISIKDKINSYFVLFNKLRQYQRIKSTSELVSIIYDEANVYNSMRTMKNGNIRIANLDLFLLKAKAFEETSYSGLFNFLRYIEQIKTNDIDESPAAVYDEKDDVIRLLSIHSSKGLEYPIVILPNLESKLKPFNTTPKVLYDTDYGVGLMDINLVNRKSDILGPKFISIN